MNIAISSAGQTMDSIVDMRFGRCSYFIICDPAGKETKTVQNKGQWSGGGAGIAAAQQLLDEKIDVILTGNLGPNAYELIQRAGGKAYYCEEITIYEALEKYRNGQMKEIVAPGTAHHK